MILYAIKTNDGYYLSEKPEGYNDGSLKCYFVDNKKPDDTFHKKWVFVKEKPILIEREKSQSNINYRYELLDKTLKSDKLKDIFKREDVTYYNEDGDECWKSEYCQYKSLYELKSDKQPNIREKIDFEFNIVIELEKINKHGSFIFKTFGNWNQETKVDDKDIEHQLIDKIIFPDIMLPDKPCKYNSKQSYDIVRGFIKENINSHYAEITSDYDFCFTVMKKIKLSKTKKFTVDVNAWGNMFSKRKKRPKYETRFQTKK